MSLTRKLRAPAEDRGVLFDPPPAALAALCRENRRRLDRPDVVVAALPLAEFRSAARGELLAASAGYLAAAGQPLPPADPDKPLIVSGHQPEFPHPGVWAKHFALHNAAARLGMTALNLVVDNDTLKSASLRVPAWDKFEPGSVRLRPVPFDDFAGEVPFEDRAVLDPATWDDAPRRIVEAADRWGYTPLAGDFWNVMGRLSGPATPLGERVTRGRRHFERLWGVRNHELPLSWLCETESFGRFVDHLLGDLPRFRDAYNRAVSGYRGRHKIKSRSHPVPDLAADGDWVEAPLWAWPAAGPRRRPVWADARGRMTPDAPGVKVRSRALVTTMFARLAVGDLFIHGIGGGKYDEVTDAVIADYFGVEPPAYVVVTATLRPPVPGFAATPGDRRRRQRELRDRLWKPWHHLPEGVGGEARRLAAERERLVRCRPAGHVARRERFYRLQELTAALRGHLGPAVADAERMVTTAERECAANALLGRRDFAAVLFPEAYLREFLAPLGRL